MKSLNNKTIGILGVIILGLSLFLLYRAFYQDRVLVTVGDYKITEKDKDLRDQIQKIFYPQDPNSYGLEQLITAFTYAQILKNNGHEITDHILRAEEMRINNNSKAPKTLAKIRALFKGDDESFKKVFILPTYAERTIYYDFFSKNPKAQANSLRKVQEILAQVQNSPRPLQDIAREFELDFKKFTLSKANGLEWQRETSQNQVDKRDQPELVDLSTQAPLDIRNHVDQELQGKSMESVQFWIDNVLKNMKPGEILNSPVDFQEAWLIVRYVSKKNKDSFQMEAILVPKDSYQQWLQSETAKVSIAK